MRLRRAVGAGAVGLGALALANRSRRATSIDPPLGRRPETYRWCGFDTAYTEVGDPDAPDLVLLHGVNAAASSHEFRRVVDALAEEYHVLAPDLPGFGASARPPLSYSGPLYVRFVVDFLRTVADDPTVVGSSLSGAYAALAVAAGAPARRLALVCPTATTIPRRRVWLQYLVRSPVVGEALFNAVTSKPAIRHFLHDHGFADPANVTEEWVEYDHATAHQPGARFAPASFLSGALDVDADLAAVLAALDVPTPLVWGAEASLTPASAGRELADRSGAELVVLDGAGLLPHAERPDAFVDAVRERAPVES